MEEYYYEEESPKHIFVKCLMIIFILGILFGMFLYYKKKSTISLKNIKVEVGSELSTDVKDYLKNNTLYSNRYKLYLNSVDVNTVGKYEYKVKYNKHVEKGYINVVDTTPPKVVIDDDVIISNKEDFNPNILVLKCDDASLPCTVSLKNKRDTDTLKNVGKYSINIIISDSEGNTKEETVNVTVSDDEKVSSKMTNDLNYYTNSENDDIIEHILFVTLSSAISEESDEYDKLLLDTSVLDFNEYVTKDIYSTKIITAYNKYGYVIGLQVLVTFNDGTTKLIKDKVTE